MMDEGKHMYLSKELKNVRTRGQRLLAKSNLGSMIPRMVAMLIKQLLIPCSFDGYLELLMVELNQNIFRIFV